MNTLASLLNTPILKPTAATFVSACLSLANLAAEPTPDSPRLSSGQELARIHMPVGGILAGQLYVDGDGGLIRWDIMNLAGLGKSRLLRKFSNPEKPLQQGFAVRLKSPASNAKTFPLDQATFPKTTFQSDYPVGIVRYSGADNMPLEITLEGIAPFVPLDTLASATPAAFLRFTLKNSGAAPVSGDLVGWLENGVAIHSGTNDDGTRGANVRKQPGSIAIEFSAEPSKTGGEDSALQPSVVADFEAADYAGWKTSGAAFGNSPSKYGAAGWPAPGGDGAVRKRACAASLNGSVSATGSLESPLFEISREALQFWLSGVKDAEKVRIELMVDGKPVRTATPVDEKNLRQEIWDVRDLKGKMAQLRIIDESPTGWIAVDQIEQDGRHFGPLRQRQDFGGMAFLLLEPPAQSTAVPSMKANPNEGMPQEKAPDTMPLGERQVGLISVPFDLQPGESKTYTFAIAWNFPNLTMKEWAKGKTIPWSGRWYASLYPTISDVVDYPSKNGSEIVAKTDLWRSTYYDSTLPRWVLDRSIDNLSTLATATCFRFSDGFFYGFEGVYSFPGCCSHVWHYAEGHARLFPDLELALFKQGAFAPEVGIQPDGSIPFRLGQLRPTNHAGTVRGIHYPEIRTPSDSCGEPGARVCSQGPPCGSGRHADSSAIHCPGRAGQSDIPIGDRSEGRGFARDQLRTLRSKTSPLP